MTDQFNGDNANLIASINALLALDASGSLEPHGIGGHARFLLETSASRLQAISHAAGQDGEQCRAASDRAEVAVDLPKIRRLVGPRPMIYMNSWDGQPPCLTLNNACGVIHDLMDEVERLRALSRGVPEGKKYPPDVVRVIDDFASGDVNCLRCNRKISLYFNGGELDAEECCGLRFTTEPSDGYCLVIRDTAIAAQRKEGA